MIDKPAYGVPSMAEIGGIPWNGYKVVSTFSGCGGSCLGYAMAGFRVVWANEFVPAAQETYRANFPGSFLDTRDIRNISPESILSAVSLAPGEIDILDGSPPCDPFSTAGKRERGWGKVKKYSDRAQRTDDLFFEYSRLLRGLQPKVFVAENVAGLIKGTAKGYFKLILKELKSCGYQIEARLLDAQWLGVPQMRERLIFIGVREDLGLSPVFPKPLPYRYTFQEAIAGIESSTEAQDTNIDRFAIGKLWDEIGPGEAHPKRFNLTKPALDRPCPTITATGGDLGAASVVHPLEKRKFTLAELKRLATFPDDFAFTGTYSQNWERIGNCVPPVMMSHIAITIRDNILSKLKQSESEQSPRSNASVR